MNLYYNKKSSKSAINSFADWKRLFNESETETKSTWKEKRSACTLARVMCPENCMALPVMSNVISRIPALKGLHLDLTEGYVEKYAKFDDYKHPRQHDIEFVGTVGRYKVVVPVEAKVDEYFGDKYLHEALHAKVKEGSHAVDRAKGLQKMFRISDSVSEKIRYQLTYYVAGSLADAKREGADIAVMPIMVFKTSEYNKEIGNGNHKDFLEFIDATDFSKVADNVYVKLIDGVWMYFVWYEMEVGDDTYERLTRQCSRKSI